jgi:hypothetical protein
VTNATDDARVSFEAKNAMKRRKMMIMNLVKISGFYGGMKDMLLKDVNVFRRKKVCFFCLVMSAILITKMQKRCVDL